jgi:hypothetical protein
MRTSYLLAFAVMLIAIAGCGPRPLVEETPSKPTAAEEIDDQPVASDATPDSTAVQVDPGGSQVQVEVEHPNQ